MPILCNYEIFWQILMPDLVTIECLSYVWLCGIWDFDSIILNLFSSSLSESSIHLTILYRLLY